MPDKRLLVSSQRWRHESSTDVCPPCSVAANDVFCFAVNSSNTKHACNWPDLRVSDKTWMVTRHDRNDCCSGVGLESQAGFIRRFEGRDDSGGNVNNRFILAAVVGTQKLTHQAHTIRSSLIAAKMDWRSSARQTLMGLGLLSIAVLVMMFIKPELNDHFKHVYNVSLLEDAREKIKELNIPHYESVAKSRAKSRIFFNEHNSAMDAIDNILLKRSLKTQRKHVFTQMSAADQRKRLRKVTRKKSSGKESSKKESSKKESSKKESSKKDSSKKDSSKKDSSGKGRKRKGRKKEQ